ncbi:hypothetical protein QOZ80_1AG0020100 [Eleusine coracana subsp. coracana]|nr:hypothetical protein QOZ80_1AG0020100 [Eleusine coracana subsp. coracana]
MIEAHALDPTSGSPIRPEFNLTIRVDNTRRDSRICREEMAVTVFYAGEVVVGWADVPDFCVDKWSSAELNVPMSHADVVLSDALRRRMAAELRSGDLEFGVEVRMVFPEGLVAWFCDECRESKSRQSLQVLSVKPGQAYAPCLNLYLR